MNKAMTYAAVAGAIAVTAIGAFYFIPELLIYLDSKRVLSLSQSELKALHEA